MMFIILSNNNIHQNSHFQSPSNYVEYLIYFSNLYFIQNYNLLLCTFAMFILKHILFSFFNYFYLEKNSKNKLNRYYPMPEYINTQKIIFVNLIPIYPLFFYYYFLYFLFTINNTIFFFYFLIITTLNYYHYYLFTYLFNKDFVNDYIIHTISPYPLIISNFLFYYLFKFNSHLTILIIHRSPTSTPTLSLPKSD